ncbi:MAG: hypothetical protein HY812_11465 [Planctomycetes bacterium]|nr:hypothetical protein [Planctomycetota bacterium]
MIRLPSRAGACLALAAILGCAAPRAGALRELARYEPCFSSPGGDPSGSMPIGNGEVGLNVWVEGSGDLCFYLARTDAWSEANRLLKLGRMRVRLTPNPFAGGAPFRQTLCLAEGAIEIEGGLPGAEAALAVFVDSEQPVVRVLGRSARPVAVAVELEVWRRARRVLRGEELSSSWTMHDAPASLEVRESADVLLDAPDALEWCHRNEHSIVPLTLAHQGLMAARDAARDPLLHRTFGGQVRAAGFARQGATRLVSASPRRDFDIVIATHCAQTESVARWQDELHALAAGAPSASAARARTAAWWSEFWSRSWVFVEGDVACGAPANAHPLRVGADGDGANLFHGALGRASVYSRALAPEEIAALEGAAPGAEAPRAAGCVATFRLGEIPAGGFVEVAGEVALELPSFTLEAWVLLDAEHPVGRIFDKIAAGGADGFLLDTHPGRALRLLVGDQSLIAENALLDADWHHVAATCDAQSGALALYLDGELLAASAPPLDPAPPSRVTQAYVLQRFVQACAGRGAFPIKFNGSIFTVDPRYSGGPDLDADWRKWGGDYWWQNTRLPYHPMLASGDFEMLAPLFRFYRDVLPLCEARARLYHGARGAYFPETMTSFGTYANGDYGWDRTGRQPHEVLCPWWCYAWNQGPELVALMLDYHAYTQDERFAREELAPMASAVLAYFDSRFPRDARGKLVIQPAQALETHWHGVVNDAPTVAGLIDVGTRLCALPDALGSAEEHALWRRMRDAAPALPRAEQDGVEFLTAAETFDPSRQNVETPELYGVFPFRLVGLGKPGIEAARVAYWRRADRCDVGWAQDGHFAALLGLAGEARRVLLAKTRNSHPGHRFPAMWGPNFDWLPDQDHGSNLLGLTQLILMQCDGDAIRLLPAWPREWNVWFRLHAPRNTVVEVRWQDGRLAELRVDPPERARDVVLPP